MGIKQVTDMTTTDLVDAVTKRLPGWEHAQCELACRGLIIEAGEIVLVIDVQKRFKDYKAFTQRWVRFVHSSQSLCKRLILKIKNRAQTFNLKNRSNRQ